MLLEILTQYYTSDISVKPINIFHTLQAIQIYSLNLKFAFTLTYLLNQKEYFIYI